MEIIPGIHQLKVAASNNPFGDVYAYLVKSGGRTLLVDTGWHSEKALDSLIEQLAEAGVAPRDLDQIAITHVHVDHYGLAAPLRQQSPAELIMHEAEAADLDARYSHNDDFLTETGDFLTLNGVPDDDRRTLTRSTRAMFQSIPVIAPERVVRDGDHLRVGDFDFEVLWTPGHARGHICLYERARRILISGDHVLPDIAPNVGVLVASDGNPLGDYLASLRVSEHLPVAIVLPAHRRIFSDLGARTREIRAHHEGRVRDMIAAMDGKLMTAYQIAGALLHDASGVLWADLPPVRKQIAISGVLANIHFMRDDRLLSTTLRDGILWNRIA